MIDSAYEQAGDLVELLDRLIQLRLEGLPHPRDVAEVKRDLQERFEAMLEGPTPAARAPEDR
jgi:hypothetical protein